MNSGMSFLLSSLLFFVNFPAQAQMGLEGVSSGRYEVRKPLSRKPAQAEPIEDGEEKKTVAVTPRAIPSTELPPASSEKEVLPSEKVLTPPTEVQEPTLSEQAESLFSNKAEKIYDFYREQTHPDDVRNNRVELDLMPVIAYVDSQSNYSYRDYHSFFNAIKVRSNIWFTPLIGVSGQMLFSFAADVDSVQADSSRVPAKYENLDLGVNFRKFFGVSRKSSSLEFSVLYSDNKMTTPSDNTSRARLTSHGLGLGLKSRIPISLNYAWMVGGTLFPRLQHSEGETGIDINSGSAEESIRIGVDLGGEWKFTRFSQMTWNLGVSAERNVFDGTAQLTDPDTGHKPSNVSVTNSLYMFSLGYRWGY
ncbi:MAG: autotransporter outer membrane beta-barrel domain-containing protein [Bdellovibrio sp.]